MAQDAKKSTGFFGESSKMWKGGGEFGAYVVKSKRLVFPKATVLQLDLEANRLGITCQSLIKMWIGDRLDHCEHEALLSTLIAIVGKTFPKAKKELAKLKLPRQSLK
jgi:hypothetical protein